MSSESVDWDAVASIRSSRRRQEVVEAIHDEPGYAKEIAEKIGTKRRTVSRNIRWLKRQGLVECLTPERPHHRIYGLTQAGEAVASQL